MFKNMRLVILFDMLPNPSVKMMTSFANLGITTATTIYKIFEANSSFHVKQRTTGKAQFLFFSSFLLVLTIFSFWEEDWALGYNSMKF